MFPMPICISQNRNLMSVNMCFYANGSLLQFCCRSFHFMKSYNLQKEQGYRLSGESTSHSNENTNITFKMASVFKPR